jgi:hypothetical protein
LERKNKITVPDKMKIHILEHAHWCFQYKYHLYIDKLVIFIIKYISLYKCLQLSSGFVAQSL